MSSGALFKKEARCTAFERLQTEYGDCWVWMSFDPVHKVIPAFVVGEINQENADRLIAQTQAVNGAFSSATSGLNIGKPFSRRLVNGCNLSGRANEAGGPSPGWCPRRTCCTPRW